MRQAASTTRQSKSQGWLATAAVAALVGTVYVEATAARKPPPATPVSQSGFVDPLATYDSGRWMKADRWTNGSPFDNAWRADHVTHESTAGGVMTIQLSDRRFLGRPYSSGEYRTRGYHGYGCYEARFRPIERAGVVTSFFTFAGPYDDGGNGRHNEIDIEFVGGRSDIVQFNYWTNDDSYASRNEYPLTLGFRAAAEPHNYGFRWTADGIAWYVDGTLAYQVDDGPLDPTPKASDSLQKVMMNVWPVDATAAAWAGTFVYPGSPLHARYEWVRYDPHPDCGFTYPGSAPALAR